ncbi:MAG: HNH endonuclease signature motif containing protein [Chloroflexota bacterium]
MPAHKRTEDTHLPNGSVIYWSRRKDPYVPVMCGSCGRERMMELSNIRRATFTGICRSCVSGESWQDETLPNGSIVFWSRRKGQQVLVQCGICGCEHFTHAANIRKATFTGLCRSCVHTGLLSTTWRGGRVKKYGYIYVKVYPNHPFYKSMANSMGYIAEHRLVMAEHLGRPLESTEVVHHKNGIKTDNRIENLELFVSFYEHGKALQERHPHSGYESAETLRETFLKRLKNLFSSDE